VLLRKEQRTLSVAADASPARPAQIATIHIPVSVLKILGLKSEA
jgi:hypothetical protein